MRRLGRSPKGNEMRDSRVHLRLRPARIVALVATILVMAGCHDLTSGALWGAGIGAVAGLALGGTGESAVVGAGIGALIGPRPWPATSSTARTPIRTITTPIATTPITVVRRTTASRTADPDATTPTDTV